MHQKKVAESQIIRLLTAKYTQRKSVAESKPYPKVRVSPFGVIEVKKQKAKIVAFYLSSVAYCLLPTIAQAQSIVPEADGTATIITTDGNRMDITGGKLSGDGANLFHSFTQFGLNSNQIANFLTTPAIRNILGRVNGGSASYINGLIQVSGGNANLFLMNPAGVVFGPNASLNVPASFTATTANGIGFGSNWFSATGANDYAALVGTPNTLAFTIPHPGAIVNEGNLSVSLGQNLSLVGGTVVSTGTLSASGGRVIAAAVPGESLIRLSQPGQLLSLEIQPIAKNSSEPNTWTLPVLSLPQLLTGGSGSNATNLVVNPNGIVQLTGSGIGVADGDVVAKNVSSQTATLSASHNLTLVESQLLTTGDLNLLAKDTVRVRDSVANPFIAKAGGNLYIQGNQGIDILALNHLDQTPFQSGGNLSLVSDGTISGDAHFASGMNFSMGSLSGNTANFVSLYDPIIRANGDVDLSNANYSGAALKVEATGSIKAGNITITGPDNNIPTSDPDYTDLSTTRALILRAGLPSVTSPNLVQSIGGTVLSLGGTIFNSPRGPSSPASITIGNIKTSAQGNDKAGNVTLSAPGNITTGTIDSSNNGGNSAGNVTLTSTQGNIITDNITANQKGTGGAGDVTLFALQGSISYGNIDATNTGRGSSGNIDLKPSPSTSPSNGFLPKGIVPSPSPSPLPTASPSPSPSPSTIATPLPTPTLSPTQVSTPTGGGTSSGSTGSTSSGSTGSTSSGNTGNTSSSSTGSTSSGSTGSISSGNTGNTSSSSTGSSNSSSTGSSNSGNTGNTSSNSTGNTSSSSTGSTNSSSTGSTNSNSTGSTNSTSTGSTNSTSTGSTNSSSTGSTNSTSTGSTNSTSTGSTNSTSTGSTNSSSTGSTRSSNTGSPQVEEVQPTNQKPQANSVASSEPPNSTVEDRVAALEQSFTEELEKYLGRRIEQKPITLADIRNRLQELHNTLDIRTAVIYVSYKPAPVTPDSRNQTASDRTASDQLELLLVTAEGQSIRRPISGATRAKVQAVAQKFRTEVTNRLKLRSNSYLPSAKQLYQWLVAPLEPDLADHHIHNLLFIMDNGLRSVPIAALHDGQGFLVERYSVALMPSFTLTNPRYSNLKTARVLAMGADRFADQKPLPAVPVELSEITPTLWPGKSFLNAAFTLENLKEQRRMQPFRIVHLATHAEFQAGAPSRSYIQLWDSQLRLDQLGQMNWNNPPVDLLVLSACRTALGDEQAELGFAGLAVQAGVQSALASLWYVSDEGTLGLMTEFYEQLKTAPFRAEALRQAQVAMLKGQVRMEAGQLRTPQGNVPLPPALAQITTQQFQHPYYWAAFTLVGNPW